ncbi:unnamed protein product (macronuclear) [Paramecium tetraurelia]|uniref:Uncharacterized protein n=1 Tax=Paramecium tetraurelia TaxID=5888 RepID=A0D8C5_PARTE|nr:uncharacterized protein GSPATT00039310001 [Paramecium tetraurelia]CAK79292.1 unnamed protein product [Paramecium tetraurelia]|eukprot:XP_001446689.1 hypothetical protein (macronuclear) [Paramecium tetraurelia strain d4-2]
MQNIHNRICKPKSQCEKIEKLTQNQEILHELLKLRSTQNNSLHNYDQSQHEMQVYLTKSMSRQFKFESTTHNYILLNILKTTQQFINNRFKGYCRKEMGSIIQVLKDLIYTDQSQYTQAKTQMMLQQKHKFHIQNFQFITHRKYHKIEDLHYARNTNGCTSITLLPKKFKFQNLQKNQLTNNKKINTHLQLLALTADNASKYQKNLEAQFFLTCKSELLHLKEQDRKMFVSTKSKSSFLYCFSASISIQSPHDVVNQQESLSKLCFKNMLSNFLDEQKSTSKRDLTFMFSICTRITGWMARQTNLQYYTEQKRLSIQ